MAWRSVLIQNPARLRVRNDCLIIQQGEDETTEASLPLEDIAVVIADTQQVTLSAHTLSTLAEHDIAFICCDSRHLPSASSLPFAGHSRVSGIHRLQLSTTLPFRKRCWQSLIRQKITNQAKAVQLAGTTNPEALFALVEQVGSGDRGNIEAVAARMYFQMLYGYKFQRGAADRLNSALNYGYAIVRGAVARSLAAYGFLTTVGLQHRSELNPFNLADDFIEPLRPCVDLLCYRMMLDAEYFEAEHRQRLTELLSCDVEMQGKKQALLYACDVMAASFQAACKAGDQGRLKLPGLLDICVHEYE